MIKGLDNPLLDTAVGEDLAAQLREELELVQGRLPSLKRRPSSTAS